MITLTSATLNKSGNHPGRFVSLGKTSIQEITSNGKKKLAQIPGNDVNAFDADGHALINFRFTYALTWSTFLLLFLHPRAWIVVCKSLFSGLVLLLSAVSMFLVAALSMSLQFSPRSLAYKSNRLETTGPLQSWKLAWKHHSTSIPSFSPSGGERRRQLQAQSSVVGRTPSTYNLNVSYYMQSVSACPQARPNVLQF